MTPPSPLRVWTALLTVYFVWGSTYLAIRYAVGADTGSTGLPPLLMAGSRYLVAGGLMFAWSVRRPAADGRHDPLGRRQWFATAIVGAALLLGGNGFVTLAEKRGLASGIAAVIVATVPIWLAGLSALGGTERLAPRVLAGLVLGFGGVVVLVSAEGGSGDLGGALMVVAGSALWSLGSYWSRSAPLPRRPIVTTSMEMLCGGALLVLGGLALGETSDLDLGAVGWQAWVGWVYLITFGAMAAFTAYAWLLRNAPLSLVSTYAFVNPLVAVGLGALPPLREPLTARTLVASAIIVVGVGLIVARRRSADVTPGEPAGPVVDDDALQARSA